MSTLIEARVDTRPMAYADPSFQRLFMEKSSLAANQTELDKRVAPSNILSIPIPSPSHLPSQPSEDISSLQPVNVEIDQQPGSHPRRSAFLELPLEVRLQIYSHLLPLHPAKHAHLSPSVTYPPATSSAYFLRALSATLAFSFPNFEPAGMSEPTSFTMEPARFPVGARGQGCGFIPSALQSTCKQVYEETRTIPWQQNEYVFINWFCSGVYAARAFLRGLKPWQRSSMRWARVEVLGRDLKDSWVATMVGGRAGGGEWKDLCGLWAGDVPGSAQDGLWGLRLGIKGRVGTAGLKTEVDSSETVCDSTQPVNRGVMDVDAEWVTAGLGQMRALRWLELDIEDNEIERKDKAEFCLALGKKLSSQGRKVDVLFVEKVAEETQKTQVAASEETVWGEPEGEFPTIAGISLY